MRVSVLDVGTMGHGIIQVATMAGYEVTMCDTEAAYVDDGLDAIESNLRGGVDRDRVTPDEMATTFDRPLGTTLLETAVTDANLVVEVVPKDMELKCKTITEVEPPINDDAVIVSNTSSLSVTQILNVLERPERGLELHFFDPVHIMGLIKVVVTEQISELTLAFVTGFIEGIGETVVEVGDLSGFASSRLGIAPGVEAIRMVQEGIASSADVGIAMELGYNHPMEPLKLRGAAGLDVRLDIPEYLREEPDGHFRPPQILKRRVHAGKLGKKTDEGFYVWEDGGVVGAPEDVTD